MSRLLLTVVTVREELRRALTAIDVQSQEENSAADKEINSIQLSICTQDSWNSWGELRYQPVVTLPGLIAPGCRTPNRGSGECTRAGWTMDSWGDRGRGPRMFSAWFLLAQLFVHSASENTVELMQGPTWS